jgi:hypothetical protein
VPTVNAPDAASAAAIVERFVGCGMDLTGDRRRLDAYFPKVPKAPQAGGGGFGGSLDGDEAERDGPSGGGAEAGLGSSGGTSGGNGGGDGNGLGAQTAHGISAAAVSPSAAQAHPCCSAAGPGQPPAGGDSEAFPLDSIDAEQQAALLREFERQQRLRCSVQAREAARAAKKQRRGSGAGGGGGAAGGRRSSGSFPLTLN